MSGGIRLLGALSALVALAAGEFETPPSALLFRHCHSCHDSATRKGGFDLQALGDPGPRHAGEWEKVRDHLAENLMPPRGKPQPTPAERERMLAWVDRGLDGPAGAEPSDPGWVGPRRLTQGELNRTLGDLLGVSGEYAVSLPADSAGGSGGFDNNADGLFVSPVFLERLLDIALRAVSEARPERLDLMAPATDKAGNEAPAARRAVVEQALTRFLPRAWRRPVTAAEVQALLQVYLRSVARRVAHDEAARLAFAAALTSPNFLFRIESTRPGTAPYAISAHELATRLSYFLWSTMPDAALTAAAADGSLLKPDVLAAQCRRLLADARSRIMVRQFVGQWLGTVDLTSGRGPDQRHFPVYTAPLRTAMAEEPAVFLAALFAENGSLLDLIDCDYVRVDAQLAKHYGIAHPGGNGFARVAVADGRRGGLVTMAGVLAITSRPARTSPVLRGKWILDELLSAPPPPPPPDVKPLDESGGPSTGTLRQRLERHRADPNCTGCHQRIDPLGFGLENYDAIGRWRDGGDTVGTLPSGETFNGPRELKQVLMQRRERIIATLVERLLAYALGRHLERHDRPTVRRIQAALAADGWKAQTLVVEIAQSLPFRMKRNPLAAETRPPPAPAKPAPSPNAKDAKP